MCKQNADGRSFNLHCTPAGRTKISRIRRFKRKHEETAFRRLNDAQKHQLLTLLQMLQELTPVDISSA
ncbi:MAG: hypothetical protein R3C58_02960 [Parvularculaceae bacterium]